MAYKDITDPDLGVIRISMRRNASRVSARWHDGRVLVIIPPGVSGERLADCLKRMKPRLLAMRPANEKFVIGRPLVLDGGITFHFERGQGLGKGLEIVRARDGFLLRVGEEVDMASPQIPGIISRLMLRGAQAVTHQVLIPRARLIASRLGLSPRSISVSRGHKVLGHCSSGGDIAISAICIFLPQDLRDYIICHELAHLTEMNHSERFHRLCDTYLSGREAGLMARLRSFDWPIER